MQKQIETFKKYIIEGNVATIEGFLRKYQHLDVANWILDDNGKSALHYLARDEFCEDTPARENLARLLLNYGANIHLKDKFGATPLHEASVSFFVPLIQLFIEHGADVEQLTNTGRTVLQSPVSQGETETVNILLEAGADRVIDAIDKEGDAVIHQVLENDTEDNDVLKSLIEAGANINMPDKKGRTVLHLNVLYYKNEVANEMLLNQGADYLIEDKNGMTALQYAAKESFYPLIDGFINAKLSEYNAHSIEKNNLILDDFVEKFKIILLENPILPKPGSLRQSISSLGAEINYLSNRWDSIQQELQAMKNKKISDSGYSFYDALKVIHLFSNEKTLASIQEDALKDFPNFSRKIATVKNYVRKSEALPFDRISKMFKWPSSEKLSDIPLSNKESTGSCVFATSSAS